MQISKMNRECMNSYMQPCNLRSHLYMIRNSQNHNHYHNLYSKNWSKNNRNLSVQLEH